jgi:soluble lytic murein transglycosylase-like protein
MMSKAPAREPLLWARVDENGDVEFRDDAADPAFSPYVIGSFENAALRQRGTPHGGKVHSGKAPEWAVIWANEAAARYRIDAALVLAVMAAESSFRQDAVSGAGARGLMQLMPATAQELGIDIDDPHKNVLGGARYLAFLLKHFGDEELAIAAYNAGPGRVMRAGNRIPDIKETQNYVRVVTQLASNYRR